MFILSEAASFINRATSPRASATLAAHCAYRLATGNYVNEIDFSDLADALDTLREGGAVFNWATAYLEACDVEKRCRMIAAGEAS